MTPTTTAARSSWQLRSDTASAALDTATLERVHGWWRAANYLSVGQIYLLDNPLLRAPLHRDHVKPRLLGHWGTTPGLNFLYAHLNRAIGERAASTIYITGPGHGGSRDWWPTPTSTAPTPRRTPTSPRTRRACAGCSGSSPSPAASRRTSHRRPRARSTRAVNSATRCPTPTVRRSTTPTCWSLAVVGDGEAETGPLATSWHSNKFVNPASDGVVLPILHLNGYKIANPTVLARIPRGGARRPHARLRPQPALLHRGLRR